MKTFVYLTLAVAFFLVVLSSGVLVALAPWWAQIMRALETLSTIM